MVDAHRAGWYFKGVNYEPKLHVVLYQPEIPPNTGAVGRTCVAVGAKLWLVRPLGFQVDAKTLRRAGLDYWQHLEWEAVDSYAHLEERLPANRRWYFTKKATNTYTTANFQHGDVLIFGSESNGLPPSLLQSQADHALRIPLRAEVRSLNLSCAVAVAAYEAIRQMG